MFEFTSTRSCGTDAVKVVTMTVPDRQALVRTRLSMLGVARVGGGATAQTVEEWMTTLGHVLKSAAEFEIGVCSFEGDVEIRVEAGLEHWTCPLCRTPHMMTFRKDEM